MLEIGISKYLVKKSWFIFIALNSSFPSSLSCFVMIIFLLLLKASVVSPLMYLSFNSALSSAAEMLSVLARNVGVILVRKDDKKLQGDILSCQSNQGASIHKLLFDNICSYSTDFSQR